MIMETNNLYTIDINDFEKLEDTVAPAAVLTSYGITNYYNIYLKNNVVNSSYITVNNIFEFR